MSVTNAEAVADGKVTLPESIGQKFWRRFKQEPLVPIGAAATTVALVTAMVKMRRGERKSMNYWLRARVILQGATVIALVGGSYAYGNLKNQKEARAAAKQETALGEAAQERAAFEERLKAAEETTRLEEGYDKDDKTPSPPQGVSAAPADVDVVRSPAADASQPAQSKGFWEKLGWGGSQKKS